MTRLTLSSALLLALAGGLQAQTTAPRPAAKPAASAATSASARAATTPAATRSAPPARTAARKRTLPKPAAARTTPPRLAPKKSAARTARATATRRPGALVKAPTWTPPRASLTLVSAGTASELRDSLVALARAQVGTRYVLGGTSPERGFDCSGLIRYIAEALKMDVPRTANEQSFVGAAVAKDPSRLRPGDLLTFGSGKRVSHIGIYVGDGKFVHASTAAGRVVESRLDRKPVRGVKPWTGVRRLIAELGEDAEG